MIPLFNVERSEEEKKFEEVQGVQQEEKNKFPDTTCKLKRKLTTHAGILDRNTNAQKTIVEMYPSCLLLRFHPTNVWRRISFVLVGESWTLHVRERRSLTSDGNVKSWVVGSCWPLDVFNSPVHLAEHKSDYC